MKLVADVTLHWPKYNYLLDKVSAASGKVGLFLQMVSYFDGNYLNLMYLKFSTFI